MTVPHEEFHEAWNAEAELYGFAHSLDMTAKRKAQHRARRKSKFWRENWKVALVRVGMKSSFCRGQNERGWVATIQWFLRDETVAKIMEGQYDDDGATGKARGTSSVLDDF